MSSSNPSDPRDGTITRQEARDLLKALDKPEFSGLMDNYINEISDPNNIKETNQFLKESEAKKDLPSNVKLAKPSPGFCLKSSKYNIKRPSTRQKVFINICSYDGVSPPEKTQTNMWSLPHLLNKGRHDQDKHKKICTTYDVVFHPKAISLANDNMAFKKFVCDTAIAGINNQLLAQTEEKISNDYVIKSKFNYKGLEISYINIHGLNKGEYDDRKEPSAFHKTEIMKEVERIKGENQKKEEHEEEADKVYDLPDISGNINKDIKEQKEADANEKTPIYKVKYSDQFDINNFFYRPEDVDEVTPQYKVIIVEIETPQMASVADADLEIDVKRLKFTYKDIYLLEIPLPVEIVKDSVKAKFDKGKKVLTVKAGIVQKGGVVKRKVSEDIEVVKDEKEEKEKEKEALKRKEQEELQKKKEQEEQEALRKKQEEQEAIKKREQEAIEKKEQEKKEEVFIKGIKKEDAQNKEMPLKEVKFKVDNNEENEKEEKVLVQEVKTKDNEEKNNKISIKKNPKDEDDQPQSINESTTTAVVAPTTQKQIPYNEDTKTPISFLNFNNPWIYEVE